MLEFIPSAALFHGLNKSLQESLRRTLHRHRFQRGHLEEPSRVFTLEHPRLVYRDIEVKVFYPPEPGQNS